MYLHDPLVPVAVTVLRGDRTLQFQVPAVTVDDRDYRDISIDPQESLLPELGIFGQSVDSLVAVRSALRSNTGVYVVATSVGYGNSGTGLIPGDVVASLNGITILSVPDLRAAIHELKDGKPAVLQIERNGRFLYIEWDVEKQSLESLTDQAGKHVSEAEPGRDRR